MAQFEAGKFGDGGATGTGNVTTQVSAQFGPRDSKDVVGTVKTEGAGYELWFEAPAEVIAGEFPLLAPELPAGSIITEAFVKVTEAFVVGGTTPTVEIGTNTSEATNGFVITEAQLEALGSYDLTSTLVGTWAAPLAAKTEVGLALEGDTTVTAVGRMEILIKYTLI